MVRLWRLVVCGTGFVFGLFRSLFLSRMINGGRKNARQDGEAIRGVLITAVRLHLWFLFWCLSNPSTIM